MDQNSEKLLSDDLRDLHEVLSELKHYWKKQSSLRWNFLRGILYGFGFFIGSAIIAAGVVYFLTHLGLDGNSFLGGLIEKIVNIVDSTKR
jgi:hypothetical protein